MLLLNASSMFGLNLMGMGLYDSCILILNIRRTTIAEIAARVLTYKAAAPKPNVEAGIGPLLPFVGNSNSGRDIY